MHAPGPSFRKTAVRFALSLAILATPAMTALTAFSAISPEVETLNLSKSLRGITDSEWGQVAGEKVTETYQIMKGDTLYDISGRLFGDPRYWPKVWEINNLGILNPHMIRPGRSIAFNAGGASSLPTLGVNGESSSSEDSAASTPLAYNPVMRDGTSSLVAQNTISASDKPGPTWDDRTPKPSGEWKKLPRQTWEQIQTQLPPDIDKDGFDSRSRIERPRNTGFELDSIMACQEIEPLATITGSRYLNNYLSLGDEVTLQPGIAQLEVNQSYAILAKPLTLRRTDGQVGYSYPVQGRVKVLGVNDGQYVAEVTALKGVAERGQIVVTNPPKIQRIDPVAGPSPILARISLDTRVSTFMSAQYKWVILDRGSSDGVQPGMIFRIFQYKDPSTKKTLTSANMLVYGDVEVYQTCENFAVGQVVWAKGELQNNTPAILMTDVEDYYTRYYMNGEFAPRESLPPPSEPQLPADPELDTTAPEATPEAAPETLPETAAELPLDGGDPGLNLEQTPAPEASPSAPRGEGEDWLDKLDNGQELVPDEERELEQLEKYEDPSTQSPSPQPNEAPALEPDSSGLPPPPVEADLVEPAPTEGTDTSIPATSETNSEFEGENLAPVEVPQAPSSTPSRPRPSPSPSEGAEEDLPL